MPLKSMTGFASLSGAVPGFSWAWEARSVNARGLDLRLRLPEGSDTLDPEIRKAAKALARGSVTVNLRLTAEARAEGVRIDTDRLTAMLDALAEVEAAAGRVGRSLAPTRAADILTLRGVLGGAEAEAGAEAPWLAPARAQIAPLFAALAEARAEEGQALAAILATTLDAVAEKVAAARETAEVRAARSGELLRTRVAALLETDTALDPARLAQELALLAVKADVTEELDRLEAHVAASRGHLAAAEPVGRKLDFLMQEFNREANTLASKSGDQALTALALDLKVLIDQMREQVQNVE